MAGRTLVVVTILISIFKPNNALMYTTSPLSARGVLRTLSKQSGGMEAEITLPLPSKNHLKGFHPPPPPQKITSRASPPPPPPPPPPPKKKQTNKQAWEKINLHREDTNPGTPDTLTVDRVF